MESNEYQAFVIRGMAHRSTRTRRPMDTPALLLEMSGEVGEFINAFKHEVLWPDTAEPNHTKTLEEAGDVLWYLTAVLSSLGLKLEEAMMGNVNKLTERYGDVLESRSSV